VQLIVASSEAELVRLDNLYKRGVANGVKDLSYMSPAEFAKVHPCLCENTSHDISAHHMTYHMTYPNPDFSFSSKAWWIFEKYV